MELNRYILPLWLICAICPSFELILCLLSGLCNTICVYSGTAQINIAFLTELVSIKGAPVVVGLYQRNPLIPSITNSSCMQFQLLLYHKAISIGICSDQRIKASLDKVKINGKSVAQNDSWLLSLCYILRNKAARLDRVSYFRVFHFRVYWRNIIDSWEMQNYKRVICIAKYRYLYPKKLTASQIRKHF